MDAAKVDRYRAVATSAAREASNGDVFVERADREAGIFVEVIEGVEEARLVQLAVGERLPPDDRAAVLIDIGGGSTELTLLRGRTPVYSKSLPVGTVRLIEAFLDHGGPVSPIQLRLLDEYLDRAFVEAVPEILSLTDGRGDRLVGTGGNIETLARYDLHHTLIDRKVSVIEAGSDRLISGRCAGLDSAGRLLLRDGRHTHIVLAGQVRMH